MEAPPEALDALLLLSRLQDGRPSLPDGVPLDTLVLPPPAALEGASDGLRGDLSDPGRNPNRLDAQGWGVLYPVGKPQLLEAIQPLITWRQQEQGRPVQTFAVAPDLDFEAATRWRESFFLPRFERSEDVPLYILLLGDLSELSLELQQRLAFQHCVGRLGFTTPQGTPDLPAYEAYAVKVVQTEARAIRSPAAPSALLFTAHDGSRAVQHGYTHLIRPWLGKAQREWSLGLNVLAPAEAGAQGGSSPQELLRQARTLRGGFLFTLSHGVGVPVSSGLASAVEEQRRFQGALSFGEQGRLTAEDLSLEAFVPGGVWLAFACFGAGTPSSSAYWHWLRALCPPASGSNRSGQALEAVLETLAPGRPFLSRLPQAALANPEGPLAVIAHVDLAWQYSYDAQGQGASLDRFHSAFRQLIRGRRVGLAFSQLILERLQCVEQLGRMLDRAARDAHLRADRALKEALRQPGGSLGAASYGSEDVLLESLARGIRPTRQQAQLWMEYHDLSGYILLGDPASMLPVQADWREAPGPAASQDSSEAPSVSSRPARLEGDGTRPRLSDLQEQVIAESIMEGDVSLSGARRLGVSEETLQRWVEVYRTAGRAAVSDLLGAPPID